MLQQDHYTLINHLECRALSIIQSIIYSEIDIIDYVKNPKRLSEEEKDLKILRFQQKARSIDLILLTHNLLESLVNMGLHMNGQPELIDDTFETKYSSIIKDNKFKDAYNAYMMYYKLYYQTIFDPRLTCQPGLHDKINYIDSYRIAKNGWYVGKQLVDALNIPSQYATWEDACHFFKFPSEEQQLIELITQH